MQTYKNDPVFIDRHAVLEHLERQGYKIKKSKLYADAKKGILQIEPDGSVLDLAVRAYAATLYKKDSIDPAEKTGQRIDEEIKGLRLKNARQQIELDTLKGKYILKADVEMELVSRVALFESCMRHFFITQAPALIDACAGDRQRLEDVQGILNRELDKQLTAMADVEQFQITFKDGEPEGEPLLTECIESPEEG